MRGKGANPPLESGLLASPSASTHWSPAVSCAGSGSRTTGSTAASSALLDDHAVGTTATENDFEELLLKICDDHGITRPRCQQPVAPYRAEFVWPGQRLIAEADVQGESRYAQGLRGRPPSRQ